MTPHRQISNWLAWLGLADIEKPKQDRPALADWKTRQQVSYSIGLLRDISVLRK
jgi:hypothetical protein